MSLINLDETDYDLTSELAQWENHMALPNFDSSQSTPISSQETSHSSSVAPDSSQSRAESATLVADEGTICYGMVSSHSICHPDPSDVGNDSPAIDAQR